MKRLILNKGLLFAFLVICLLSGYSYAAVSPLRARLSNLNRSTRKISSVKKPAKISSRISALRKNNSAKKRSAKPVINRKILNKTARAGKASFALGNKIETSNFGKSGKNNKRGSEQLKKRGSFLVRRLASLKGRGDKSSDKDAGAISGKDNKRDTGNFSRSNTFQSAKLDSTSKRLLRDDNNGESKAQTPEQRLNSLRQLSVLESAEGQSNTQAENADEEGQGTSTPVEYGDQMDIEAAGSDGQDDQATQGESQTVQSTGVNGEVPTTSDPAGVVDVTAPVIEDRAEIEAALDYSGDPIGGGEGYSEIYTSEEADAVVHNEEEFSAALSQAQAGDVIYIDDNSVIDLTGQENLAVPAGVTIASGRGNNGSEGGVITQTEMESGKTIHKCLETGGDGVVLSGVRLIGPEFQTRGSPNSHNKWRGIETKHDLEVENCEIAGWQLGGVHIYPGDGDNEVHVHHCWIHHNQRKGFGYGVHVDGANALVEANIFDYNRHDITGAAKDTTTYKARYNISGPHHISHCFDQHGEGEDSGKDAGSSHDIHNNYFAETENEGIKIRGVPRHGSEIYNNVFVGKYDKNHKKGVIAQKNYYEGLDVHDNKFEQPPFNIRW